eukprot:5862180-Prymnesium_polylepis.1
MLCKKRKSSVADSLNSFGHLSNGSKARREAGYFVLDTCLVVGEAIDAVALSSEDASHGRRGGAARQSDLCLSDADWSRAVGRRRMQAALADADVSAATRAVWGEALESSVPSDQADRAPRWIGSWPTKGSKGPYLKTLYTGASFADRERFGGCFSFVPAVVSEQGTFKARPKLRLASTADGDAGLDVLCNGLCSQLVAAKALGKAGVTALWQSVVAQVRSQGFELATWVAPPARMPCAVADAISSGIPVPEIELAESDLGAL